MEKIFIGKARRCWNCGNVNSRPYKPVYCCDEKRVYKYVFFGKCNISGAHNHYKCHKCGHTWVCTPTMDKWTCWQKNVIDKYKSWTTEQVKNDLIKNSLPCAVLAQNIDQDFNVAAMMRSANFFGITNFYYFGKKHYDKRAAMGVQHYLNIRHLSSIDDIKKLKSKYELVGMENNLPNTKNSIPLKSFNWNDNTLFVFGEESIGIDNHILELCDSIIEIEGTGSVRSLNVASAAAITFYDYVSKLKQ
jgi:tRNA(Leu) C34 or U34 (ribose-2'-O)-methylase TrmL